MTVHETPRMSAETEQNAASANPQKDGAPSLTLEHFTARFKARMLERAGPTFADGSSIADYADETAPSYWEEGPGPFTESPEDCADADISYWEAAHD